MKCPNCGFEQPEGLSDCQKCQIIFAKWADRQNKPAVTGSDAPAVYASPVPTASRPSSSNFSALVQGLLLAAVVGAGLWMFFGGGGLPVPEGALVRGQQGFACSPLPGWVLLTRENLGDVEKQYGAAIPDRMKSSISSGAVELGLVKVQGGGIFPASVNVVVYKGYVPKVTEKNKKKAADMIAGEYQKRFWNYVQDVVEIVPVDRLNVLKISSRARADVETVKDLELKFVQLMVPGDGRAYFITCMAEAYDFSQYASAFNDFLNSFRVTDRPSPLGGPVLSGGLKAGLTAAGISLLLSFLKALFQ